MREFVESTMNRNLLACVSLAQGLVLQSKLFVSFFARANLQEMVGSGTVPFLQLYCIVAIGN